MLPIFPSARNTFRECPLPSRGPPHPLIIIIIIIINITIIIIIIIIIIITLPMLLTLFMLALINQRRSEICALRAGTEIHTPRSLRKSIAALKPRTEDARADLDEDEDEEAAERQRMLEESKTKKRPLYKEGNTVRRQSRALPPRVGFPSRPAVARCILRSEAASSQARRR